MTVHCTLFAWLTAMPEWASKPAQYGERLLSAQTADFGGLPQARGQQVLHDIRVTFVSCGV
jgi:hypothetical protein